jgi:hypothetical protein
MYGHRVMSVFLVLALVAWAFLSLTVVTTIRAHEPHGDSLCQCADHFGGFGPLWDSYCADKHRCRGCATARCGVMACPGICHVPPPTFRGPSWWHGMRARMHRQVPCGSGGTCDAPACDSAADSISEDAEGQVREVGISPWETSDVPPLPVPEDDRVSGPRSHSSVPAHPTSSRRAWIHRRTVTPAD